MSEHITNLIEERRLSELSESELSTIRAHVSVCVDCLRGYEAAQISAVLLKERAAEAFEPSPFFHTRVLATLRERQAANQPWAWARVWQAAGALASSMVVTVAALAIFTFATPGTPEGAGPQELATNSYSAEEIIFNQSEFADDQVSDGQILRTLYGPEEEAVK
jgi:hypothetical protein